MKKSNLSLESNDKRRKDLHRDIIQHSRLEEAKLRRRQEWMIQQKREKEHEELKKRKILEYELKRARDISGSNSRGRSTKESDSKIKTRDSSLEKLCIQKTKATSSKSSVMAEKLDTSDGGNSTTIFQGPEGIKISEKELHCITVNIHRNLSVETPPGELHREIINPKEVIIKRRIGEGSKPIFEREEIQSKKVEEIKEHRTVVAIESEDTGNRSESFRRRSPSSNLLKHRSQRSSSSQRSKSKESKNSNCKSDWNISKKSDRRQSRERYYERDRRDHEYDHPSSSSSSNRYRSSRNRVSSYRDYRDYRRDSYAEQDFSHRSESRRDDKEEESSSSSKPRNHPSTRERRSRSRSRSRDSRYRERQMVPSYCIDQMPYSIYYGPRPPMMVGPIMPFRGQVPIRGRLPPSLIGPIRPFPPRFMPPNVFRLGPPSNYRPMF